MHRPAALLLCALVAAGGGLLGAPAPFPRSEGPGAWVKGWDRPIDPAGGCRFDRQDGRLAITVTGKDHYLELQSVFVPGKGFQAVGGRLTAPHLLRATEGDFAVVVRVGGDLRAADLKDPYAGRSAGILLTDGKTFVRLARSEYVFPNDAEATHGFLPPRTQHEPSTFLPMPQARGKPYFLRLERRGDAVRSAASQDGRKWEPLEDQPRKIKLPRKLKMGVLAESTTLGTFKVVFDRWKLTPLPRGR